MNFAFSVCDASVFVNAGVYCSVILLTVGYIDFGNGVFSGVGYIGVPSLTDPVTYSGILRIPSVRSSLAAARPRPQSRRCVR